MELNKRLKDFLLENGVYDAFFLEVKNSAKVIDELDEDELWDDSDVINAVNCHIEDFGHEVVLENCLWIYDRLKTNSRLIDGKYVPMDWAELRDDWCQKR